jgi:drug/metabolite transporter (DMT)-like permease
MTRFGKSHLRTILLLPVIIILGPIGNTLLSKGMKNVGTHMSWSRDEIWAIFVSIFTSPYIWLGIGSLMASYLVYMLILTWADYSYVQPVSALSYVTVSLLGYFWLGESVVTLRWVGIGIIFVGAMIIAETPHRTHDKSENA